MDFWVFLQDVFDTWVEKVGIILTILPFIEKIPRVRTWLQEKPILDRFVPLLWVVGIACMVGGFYSAWDDQRRAAMRANQQLESLSKPELTGLINQVVIGDDPGEVGCQFFIDIAVKNSGAPSIAYDWELSMDQPPLNRIGAAYIQEGYMMKKNNKPYAIFQRNMRAEERVMKIPIQQGAFEGGWLRFVMRGATPDDCKKANKTLYFKDIKDREYSIKFQSFPNENMPVVSPSSGDSPYVMPK